MERDMSAKLCYFKAAVHNAIVKFNTNGMFCDSKRSGRLQKTTLRDDHGMRCINELRQENVGCFTRKRYENKSQYLCEMLGHGIWAQVKRGSHA